MQEELEEVTFTFIMSAYICYECNIVTLGLHVIRDIEGKASAEQIQPGLDTEKTSKYIGESARKRGAVGHGVVRVVRRCS